MLEIDSAILKKKQNLPEMEHRLCDRIDDVVRVLKATCAEKHELTRKWRILEHRLESTLEIILMLMGSESDELRQIVQGIAKNSKKLKNPNMLLTHIN